MKMQGEIEKIALFNISRLKMKIAQLRLVLRQDHVMLKTHVLVRSPKLRNIERSQ